MPKIKINDINMFYETHGKGDAIVFIAGFSADHIVWNEIIDFFKNDYQVILLDNRGSGQTDVPIGPYSIEQMADDVATLCKQLAIKQAIIVGNSMGGFIAQTLCRNYPELVRALVISNSTMTIESGFNIYLKAQLELIKANAPAAALIKASLSWAFSFQFLSQPGVLEQLIQMNLENPYPFSITGYEGQYAALEKFNSSSWVHEIKKPTLVIAGDEDLIFLKESVKTLADNIDGSEFHSFKKCGHVPPIEFPEEFSNVVKKHIQTL